MAHPPSPPPASPAAPAALSPSTARAPGTAAPPAAGQPAPHTVREILAATKLWLAKKNVDNPRLDAELLLGHVLGCSRIQLFMDLDRPLNDAERTAYRALVVRRGQREPVAYILGTKEFYGLQFTVTKDTLIPRPDTETLVELALARLPAGEPCTVVDVCTGTGCVALAIKHERPTATVHASDISVAAVAVAQANAAALGLDVAVAAGDLLAPWQHLTDVTLVVANPPYIRDDERGALMPDVRDHEPALALFGDAADGLGHHRRILSQALPLLAANGAVLLEIGHSQGDAVRALLVPGFLPATVAKDLAGQDRVATFTRAQG